MRLLSITDRSNLARDITCEKSSLLNRVISRELESMLER